MTAAENPEPPAILAPPAGAPLPPRRRRPVLYAGLGGGLAVVAVVLWLGFVGVLPLGLHTNSSAPADTVRSATLTFVPANNPCFPSEYGGGRAHTVVAGGFLEFRINLSDLSGGTAHACTVTGVNVSTAGFQMESTNVPLVVPNGGTATLNVTVEVPTAAFSGNLTMTANVTFLLPNVDVVNQNVTYAPSSDSGACGASPPSGLGFKTFAGTEYDDSVGFFVISPSVSCTITGVSTPTAGFAIASSDTPYGLPIDSFGGVTFVLSVPDQAYTGNVSIVLELSE